MIHSVSLWDLFAQGMLRPLGWSKDQSGVLRLWAVYAGLCRYNLWAPVYRTGSSGRHGSPLSSCTGLHANLGWRDIWHDLLNLCFVNARPTTVLAQVSQNLPSATLKPSEPRASMWRCIGKSTTSGLQEVIVPLDPALIRGQVEFWVQLCISQYKKDIDHLEQVQWRDDQSGWWLEQVMQMEKLRELVYFSLEKGQLKGDLIAVCSYLLAGCREDESRLSWESSVKEQKATDTTWKTGNST